LVWARARLYPDRLTLTGRFLWNCYHRSVPLERIDEVEVTDRQLAVHLTDGSVIRVLLDAPSQWADAILIHRDVREGSE
jgi:hypothetical protein